MIAIACSASNDSSSTHAPNSLAGSTATAAVPFGPTAYGEIPMCAPLDSVAVLAPRIDATSVRDTVIESEEERWPAKLVVLADSSTALLESSWMDTTRVWRFSTTSPRARTTHGAQVEATVGELAATSGPFGVEITEGAVRVVLAGDGVGARVDTASEHAVQASMARGTDTPHALPASARVMELIAAGRCAPRR